MSIARMMTSLIDGQLGGSYHGGLTAHFRPWTAFVTKDFSLMTTFLSSSLLSTCPLSWVANID